MVSNVICVCWACVVDVSLLVVSMGEKLEPITVRAEPGPVLPVHDVITYLLSTQLYPIYVNYSFGKVIVATVEKRITTLWIAGVRQHSDGMHGEGGENCDELCVRVCLITVHTY